MPPKEVPVNRDLNSLAPKVKQAAERVLAGMKDAGFKAIQFDCRRSTERQSFLFGKGRMPEQCIEQGISAYWAWPTCPDGKVTKTMGSVHRLGLAVDIVENDASPWVASQAFWHKLGELYVANDLVWGGSWTRFPDLPHGQWRQYPQTFDVTDLQLMEKNGIEAVWQKYHAI